MKSFLLREIDSRLQRITDRERYVLDPAAFAYEVIGHDTLALAAGRDVELTEKQVEFLRAFVNRDVHSLIISTGRGCSKTFLFAIGIALLCYTDSAFTVTHQAGSFVQARYLYHYFSIFARSEKFARCLARSGVQHTKTDLIGGGWLYVLTTSEKQQKGLHPAMLSIDEACAADSKSIELAMGQLIGSRSDKPLLRMASTPDKLHHLFHDYWLRADELGFVKFQWRAVDCPWISVEQVERERQRHDKNWCKIHLDGLFGSATGTVFDYDDVEACTSEDALEAFAEKSDLVYEIARTCVGVDWGYVHPTVFCVVSFVKLYAKSSTERMKPQLSLYFVRHVEEHKHVPELRLYSRARELMQEYDADAYLDSSHIFQNETVKQIAAEVQHDAHDVVFSKDKMAMVGWLTSLLERRAIRIPREFRTLLEQLSEYSWEEDREKPKKGDDDDVDAIMLATWGFSEPQWGASSADIEDVFR